MASPGINVNIINNPVANLATDNPIYLLVTGTIGVGSVIPVTATTDIAATIGTTLSTNYITEFFKEGHNLNLVVGSDLSSCLSAMNTNTVDSGYILAPEFAVSSLTWPADCLLIDAKAKEVNCVFLADPTDEDKATIGDSGSGVRGLANALSGTTNTALFFPYVTGDNEVPPSVKVAAITSKKLLGEAAAGSTNPISAVSLSLGLSKADRDTLYAENINPLFYYKRFGYLIYGVRLLSGGNILSQAITNKVVEDLNILLEPVLFSPNITNEVYARANAIVKSYLNNLWQDGLLIGENSDTAFTVVVNDTNNTLEGIIAGTLNISVTIKPAASIEFIEVSLTVTN